MSLFRTLGKKHMEVAKLWTTSGAVFGGAAVSLFLYFSDWKAVVAYIPLYGSKFDREPPR